jgi:hypothetical protein
LNRLLCTQNNLEDELEGVAAVTQQDPFDLTPQCWPWQCYAPARDQARKTKRER